MGTHSEEVSAERHLENSVYSGFIGRVRAGVLVLAGLGALVSGCTGLGKEGSKMFLRQTALGAAQAGAYGWGDQTGRNLAGGNNPQVNVYGYPNSDGVWITPPNNSSESPKRIIVDTQVIDLDNNKDILRGVDQVNAGNYVFDLIEFGRYSKSGYLIKEFHNGNLRDSYVWRCSVKEEQGAKVAVIEKDGRFMASRKFGQ